MYSGRTGVKLVRACAKAKPWPPVILGEAIAPVLRAPLMHTSPTCAATVFQTCKMNAEMRSGMLLEATGALGGDAELAGVGAVGLLQGFRG